MVLSIHMKRQLNPRTRTIASNGEAKNYLKKHGRVYALFTGNDENYFKMSDYQKKKLAQKNIELVDFPDGSGRQYMQHTEYNQDGTVKKVTNVVADADQIGDIPGAIDFESAMATDADTAFATTMLCRKSDGARANMHEAKEISDIHIIAK